MGILLGLFFLIIATFFYPGGTNEDVNSVGYDWGHNYISNLLGPLAVNGEVNAARPFSIFGVFALTASFGLFFVKFSERIKVKSAAFVIKYFGILATVLGFITIVPAMHDLMVTISSILTLVIFFYLTVIVLKSKLSILKALSVVFLAAFYVGAYMYFGRWHLEYMPIMQKIIFLIKIVWILTLEYFTREEDFQFITT